MNVWSKILVFFPLWIFFSMIFYGIVFLIYPESYSGSKEEFDTLMSNNFGFLIMSQIAVFLGTFSAILFVSKFIDNHWPDYFKSMLNPNGFLLGIILGIIGIFIIIFILSLTTKIQVKFHGFDIGILWYLLIFLLVAISEEVMARGFLFTNLYKHSNKYLAIIISSLIFSLMHFYNSSFNIIGMINIVLVGILFCELYLKDMNLSIPIGFHFSWNFLQGPVFGFSVSGLVTQGILKIDISDGTKFSFEGFGLEGSIITTLVIGIFIFYFYMYYTRKRINSYKAELSSSTIVVQN
jgi:uncharacterized protein